MTLPAELQVGRRARAPSGTAPAVTDETDGCSRQDPAYRPAKGSPRERGGFLRPGAYAGAGALRRPAEPDRSSNSGLGEACPGE
jgi:hypothetical protein